MASHGIKIIPFGFFITLRHWYFFTGSRSSIEWAGLDSRNDDGVVGKDPDIRWNNQGNSPSKGLGLASGTEKH